MLETLFKWTVDWGWVFAATSFMTIADALQDEVNLAIWMPLMALHILAELKFWQLRPLVLDFIELEKELEGEEFDGMFEDWEDEEQF